MMKWRYWLWRVKGAAHGTVILAGAIGFHFLPWQFALPLTLFVFGLVWTLAKEPWE